LKILFLPMFKLASWRLRQYVGDWPQIQSKSPLKFSVAALIWSLALFNSSGLQADFLPNAVSQNLAKYQIPESAFSLLVLDADTSKIVVEHLADEPRNPASVMKILTSYAALDLLGPDFNWKTQLFTDSAIKDGTLSGNLFIKGGGDPLILVEDLWRIVYELRNRGLHTINGDLTVDQSYFDGTQIVREPLDGKHYRAYNAYPEALVINFRATRFIFIANADGVHILADPPASTLLIKNNVQLTKGKCNRHHRNLRFSTQTEGLAETIITFSGNYAIGCKEQSRTLVVLNSSDYLLGVFKSLWQAQGGKFDGEISQSDIPPNAILLQEHSSRPLLDVLRGINKYSNNLMARSLLMTLGAEVYDPPGTTESGRIAIKSWLNTRKISMPELHITNGAGLSRAARLSARGLGNLMIDLYRHPWREELLASMSLLGIDGSAKKRLRKKSARGYFRLKTGLLRSVRSAAGFGLTKSGKRVVVVMLQNHPNTNYSNGNAIQNSLLEWVFDNY
jgi:D-alanyl-D-alanine carboxypeptidase/D-alanyl-D-alanine-endopeptidase (penicillin-binding protein 4)